MKKILSLMLAAGSLFLFGCTNSGPSSDTSPAVDQQQETKRQTYTNKKDGFSLQFPEGRTFQEDVYGSSVMFFSPLQEKDTLRENIGIIKKPLDKTYSLDEYYALTQPELSTLIPEYKEISKESLTINGYQAYKLIYQGKQGNILLQRAQVYLIHNQHVYIITYTATQKTFHQYAKILDAMIQTFTLQ